MLVDIKINIRHAQRSDTPAINALLSQIVQVHNATRPDIFRSSYEYKDMSFVEEDDGLYLSLLMKMNVWWVAFGALLQMKDAIR